MAAITTTLLRVGDSLGLLLNEEITNRLNLKEGDEVFLVETQEGLSLTTRDPGFTHALEVATKGMDKYKNALRELAK